MTGFLTRVHLHYGRDLFNNYIRFGIPKYRDDFTGREAYEYYPAGAIFGYIKWQANDYDTKSWRFFVLRAGDDTTPQQVIYGITPGAEILADISGKERVQRFFKAIDQIEARDIDGSDVAPDYWVQSNARINSSLDPLPYRPEQHRAWLLERAVS
ncbi:DUF2840 domain-containing protein [Paremcibacter congregatus]|uniref:Glycosidase n=1 Tax=Paremcibacter congregatus TaxID=2043170 RepID=A0A2G4YZ51_9PROT|nr:DUF2840 domain-containing protein [Paremcibacter congregatus]PHZ86726.1 hypothetical protein CRD36_00290 [Paremcibacter congregatus]QDE27620.1 DUF2840 domain-containing protein [Paremcibacter congregatus]